MEAYIDTGIMMLLPEEAKIGFLLDDDRSMKLLVVCEATGETPFSLISQAIDTIYAAHLGAAEHGYKKTR